MKSIISSFTTVCCLSFLCMAIFSGLGINPAYAHCKGKHSDYEPHCGGGGDPGGGENACMISTTFPAFVYWDASSGSGARLTLSDADGGCTHALTSFDNGGSLTGETALHYTPSGADYAPGSGRVIWTNKFVGTMLFLVEFTVDSSNSVNVSVNSEVLAEGPWGGENGSIRHPDIAPDGDTFGLINRWASDGSSGSPGYTIYTGSIDRCASAPEPWNLLDPAGCGDSLSTIITEGPVPDQPAGDAGGFYWNDLTFNDDATKIYLNQFINSLGGGTYVVDLTASVLGYTRISQLPFPESIAEIDLGPGIGVRELSASGSSSAINPCGEVIVIDIDNCVSANLCDSIISQDLLGREPSWLEDDGLVYQERIYKRQGRNYSCKSGGMGVAHPFDPESPVPVHATDGGWEPLGWRR